MNYPNGQTVSDAKKATSEFASGAKKLGSELKSDMKSEAKSAGSKLERAADSAIHTGSSIADDVISAVASYLPVKNTDEAISMLQSTVEDVQSSVMTARDSAASFIKKYPFYSLIGAGLVGAAAVMLLTPRKRTIDLH
ncbi:hypothetical protein BH10BDE1_BH10BDE1_11530 [soil metagenome]